MLKFKDYIYKRPNTIEIKNKFQKIISEFKLAKSLEEQKEIINKYKILHDEINTLSTICDIRNDINLLDKFYLEEKAFWNEFKPDLTDYYTQFTDALLSSVFRKELEKEYGQYLFKKYEIDRRTFDNSIKDEMVIENNLVSMYHKLLAVGTVEFMGKKTSLNNISTYRQSQDRKTRKLANETYFKYFENKMDVFDKLYDDLVKIRSKMAKKLGYKNFIQMAYDRMGRSDYNAKDVAKYRKQILETLVPLVSKLKKRQEQRLKIKRLYYYDDKIKFLNGNPKPKGNPEWIMENGKKMYKELGKNFEEFFDFMTNHELFDVLGRENKKAGGYCAFIHNYKSPFIFANFNGTAEDIDVLTHEAGHAFQVYNTSRTHHVSEYIWPTMDAAEIHSMSMEFLTWPYMNLFFEKEAEKYKFNHITSCLEFIPYGALIDEFQHVVYKHPEMTPKERRRIFRELEKKYQPHIDYDDNLFLENGGLFFRQLHIFSVPFYYIDYTLAQVCALQFWHKSTQNRQETMEVYTNLCKAGGSKPFLSLLKVGGLKNPFLDGTIKETIKPVIKYIENVDDTKF